MRPPSRNARFEPSVHPSPPTSRPAPAVACPHSRRAAAPYTDEATTRTCCRRAPSKAPCTAAPRPSSLLGQAHGQEHTLAQVVPVHRPPGAVRVAVRSKVHKGRPLAPGGQPSALVPREGREEGSKARLLHGRRDATHHERHVAPGPGSRRGSGLGVESRARSRGLVGVLALLVARALRRAGPRRGGPSGGKRALLLGKRDAHGLAEDGAVV
mmetsp:Transcript_23329/g.88507  ORF Transcript_23329/g.88507 Transcript_23329/m.88507 type:complete len:212 (+) Transcript_23329:2677-3312(+)